MPMNPEVKQLWIEDLRAHPELQGCGSLLTPDGLYCCLGRLCVLAIEFGIIEGPLRHQWSGFYQGPWDNTRLLPDAVIEWSGVRRDLEQTLAQNNDSGSSFATIADDLEKL